MIDIAITDFSGKSQKEWSGESIYLWTLGPSNPFPCPALNRILMDEGNLCIWQIKARSHIKEKQTNRRLRQLLFVFWVNFVTLVASKDPVRVIFYKRQFMFPRFCVPCEWFFFFSSCSHIFRFGRLAQSTLPQVFGKWKMRCFLEKIHVDEINQRIECVVNDVVTPVIHVFLALKTLHYFLWKKRTCFVGSHWESTIVTIVLGTCQVFRFYVCLRGQGFPQLHKVSIPDCFPCKGEAEWFARGMFFVTPVTVSFNMGSRHRIFESQKAIVSKTSVCTPPKSHVVAVLAIHFPSFSG